MLTIRRLLVVVACLAMSVVVAGQDNAPSVSADLVGLTDDRVREMYGPPSAVDGVNDVRWTFNASGQFSMYVYRRGGKVVDVWPRDARLSGAVNSTPQGANPPPDVRTSCAKEWPTDFQMRAFCEKQQLEGMAALKTRTMASGDRLTIRQKCATDWPNDFQMRNFCEEQQLKALDSLR